MRRRRGGNGLPVTGKGWAICDRSGKQGLASDMMDDVRGGRVLREFADITPGFGTYHPQDLENAPDGDDPRPIQNARHNLENTSLTDKGYTDAQIKAAIRSGRPLGAPGE